MRRAVNGFANHLLQPLTDRAPRQLKRSVRSLMIAPVPATATQRPRWPTKALSFSALKRDYDCSSVGLAAAKSQPLRRFQTLVVDAATRPDHALILRFSSFNCNPEHRFRSRRQRRTRARNRSTIADELGGAPVTFFWPVSESNSKLLSSQQRWPVLMASSS